MPQHLSTVVGDGRQGITAINFLATEILFPYQDIFCLCNLISLLDFFSNTELDITTWLKKKKRYLADNQSHLFNCWSTWKASETQRQQRTRNYLSTVFGHWGSLGEERDAVCLKQANKTLTGRPFICTVLYYKILWREYILTWSLSENADTLSYGSPHPWGWMILWQKGPSETKGSAGSGVMLH